MFDSPKRLALFNAAIITLATAIAIIVTTSILNTFSALLTLIISIIVFGVSYAIIYSTLERFFYRKIKLIYKTIHNLKRPKGHKSQPYDMHQDVLEKVNIEVKEWADSQSKKIKDLEELADYRREFLGNVSHELKTPIFNIQGYVLTLLDGGLEDTNINRKFLLKTENSINRMITIVNDLEAISKLESGELLPKMKLFDIIVLTQEVIEFLEVKAKARNNKVTLRYPQERNVQVYADREKIRQVLTNLIENSIRYGKENDGNTTITFFDMDENILVEVTDDGIGIPDESIPRIFERFYRIDKARSRSHGGTGLGLAIVKHIIHSHNQTINVRSKIGVGTTFGFTLAKRKAD